MINIFYPAAEFLLAVGQIFIICANILYTLCHNIILTVAVFQNCAEIHVTNSVKFRKYIQKNQSHGHMSWLALGKAGF